MTLGLTDARTVIDKIAWIHVESRAILSTRTRDKDVYYLPGGKREPGETELQTLVREVREELDVAIVTDTAAYLGIFEAQAHDHADGVTVTMTCYRADYRGMLTPSGEIDEMVWLTYEDRGSVSAVDQVIFDYLHQQDLLD